MNVFIQDASSVCTLAMVGASFDGKCSMKFKITVQMIWSEVL